MAKVKSKAIKCVKPRCRGKPKATVNSKGTFYECPNCGTDWFVPGKKE